MKMKLLLIFFIQFTIMSCNSQLQKTDYKETENRIVVLLDTLKNDYYWQMVPTDLMGRIPTAEDYEYERIKFPYRTERNLYLKELDSLSKKDLTEEFLIFQLNKEHRQELKIRIDKIFIDKLMLFETENANQALYNYLIKNPKEHQIAKHLINKYLYTKQLNAFVIECLENHDFIDYIYYYLKLFDNKTDVIILDKVLEVLERDLKTSPYSSYLNSVIIESYFVLENDYFEKGKVKMAKDNMHIAPSAEFEDARNFYWSEYSKLVIKYYQENRNSILK